MASCSFKDVIAWQKAHAFVLETYRITRKFPDFERFGLCSQFQRAAVSVPANIAEGLKKYSRHDKIRFLNISQGSLEECRYYVILSHDLKYIDDTEFQYITNMVENVSYFLNNYINAILNNKCMDRSL